MNKADAIAHMISKVEEIERERLAAHFSIDATKQKKEAVDSILKALKEVTVDDENQQD
jgi:hypothetical protein